MGPKSSLPCFYECSAEPSLRLTVHISEHLLKCGMDIIYLRQTTYFYILPCLNFCGQRERERAKNDLEVSIR